MKKIILELLLLILMGIGIVKGGLYLVDKYGNYLGNDMKSEIRSGLVTADNFINSMIPQIKEK